MIEFIEEHREYRINTLSNVFECPVPCLPVTDEEIRYYESLADDQYLERLPLEYRLFQKYPTADNAYVIASCLNSCFQYKKSIEWYEKVIELDKADENTRGTLAYIYQQCKLYEKSISCAKYLLNCKNIMENHDIRDELYCMLADNYHFTGNDEEVISWQIKILEESKNQDLIIHTKKIMDLWAN